MNKGYLKTLGKKKHEVGRDKKENVEEIFNEMEKGFNKSKLSKGKSYGESPQFNEKKFKEEESKTKMTSYKKTPYKKDFKENEVKNSKLPFNKFDNKKKFNKDENKKLFVKKEFKSLEEELKYNETQLSFIKDKIDNIKKKMNKDNINNLDIKFGQISSIPVTKMVVTKENKNTYLTSINYLSETIDIMSNNIREDFKLLEGGNSKILPNNFKTILSISKFKDHLKKYINSYTRFELLDSYFFETTELENTSFFHGINGGINLKAAIECNSITFLGKRKFSREVNKYFRIYLNNIKSFKVNPIKMRWELITNNDEIYFVYEFMYVQYASKNYTLNTSITSEDPYITCKYIFNEEYPNSPIYKENRFRHYMKWLAYDFVENLNGDDLQIKEKEFKELIIILANDFISMNRFFKVDKLNSENDKYYNEVSEEYKRLKIKVNEFLNEFFNINRSKIEILGAYYILFNTLVKYTFKYR